MGETRGTASGRARRRVPDLSPSMELVERIQGGDRAALNELLERYESRLRRIVRIKLGPRLQRHMDEDDIVQDVFLIATRKLQALELRGQGSLLQWLTLIAQNEIRNKLKFHSALKRAQKRDVRAAGSASSSKGVRLASAGPSPSQQALRAEIEELVDAYIEELEPPEYREVILLRDYYQQTWQEIRVRLGRPTVAAAQELYRRAYLKLRERIRHLER